MRYEEIDNSLFDYIFFGSGDIARKRDCLVILGTQNARITLEKFLKK